MNTSSQELRRTSGPSVGIVHEWLTNMAGSEKCVRALRTAFPDHRIYTSVFNPEAFPGWEDVVTTSALQRVPRLRRSHLLALPAMLPAMRTLNVSRDHDLVIRSFHSFTTAAPSPPGLPEIVYCYTPPRFLYRAQSLAKESLVVRVGARASARFLRAGDQSRMRTADNVLAISHHVARRIEMVYERQAAVLHPPVDVARFQDASTTTKGDYFLFCSRLVPYKRPDIAVEAFRGLPYRLLVAGDGRLRKRLERDAPSNVSFLGWVDEETLPGLVAGARGFVFPAEEDFGIAPVEALAAGTPVVTLAAGGALDYVRDGENGLLVREQTPRAFAEGITRVANSDWNHDRISESVDRFSTDRFIAEFRQMAAEAIADRA